MGTIKDVVDVGTDTLQFWVRFKGRRVRVWPSDLTIRICSASGLKWVTSADHGEPPWWKESRQMYRKSKQETASPDALVGYAARHLANAELPNIETVEDAKLLEATISDVVRNPPGIYLTDIQYWVVVGDASDMEITKVDSTDEGMLLPMSRLARIDFIPSQPFADRGKSSWHND